VRVDGTAVHTIDYTDGLPHDERAQRTLAAVMMVMRVGVWATSHRLASAGR
jgi:hypothetical protein